MSGRSLRLNNGTYLPAPGLGTSGNKQVGHSVDIAIRAGYRSIDGAIVYENEKEVGYALQTLYKEGVVRREEIFITSKITRYELETAKQDVMASCQTVLSSLQTNYIDLFLIHGPLCIKEDADFSNLSKEDILPYNEVTIAAVWEGMEELVHKGMAKSIGLSNFSITKIERLLKTAKIIPAVNQVECHAYCQQPKLKAYLKSKGIVIQAYAPFGSPKSTWKRDPGCPVLLEDPVINEIATKYKATAAQVCISFLLHIGTCPIPKSGTESRIIENLKAAELVLSEDEVKRIEGIDKNLRYFRNNQRFMDPNYFDPIEDAQFKLEEQ